MHAPALLFLSNLFGGDMIIIVIVVLVLFGGDKLPGIVRGLGKGIREFKDASESVKREINAQIYSYEEKKAEEAAVSKYQAEQESGANHSPVANTVPVNDTYTPAADEPAKPAEESHTEQPGEHHTEPLVENNDKPVV